MDMPIELPGPRSVPRSSDHERREVGLNDHSVDDVDETVTKAQESGASVRMPASDIPDVGRMCWLGEIWPACGPCSLPVQSPPTRERPISSLRSLTVTHAGRPERTATS